MVIQRTNIAIGKKRALITTPCYDDIIANRVEKYEITTIRFDFHNTEKKLKLLWKLLGLLGNINESEMHYYDTSFRIEEDLLELIELLAPVDITESGGMMKVAEDYLKGVIGLKKFEQEVVAYCVANKLSE